MQSFGWGLMLGPFIVALAPLLGADVLTTFTAVVSLGFGLAFIGYMSGQQESWYDVGRRTMTLGERWCWLTRRHIWRDAVPGLSVCRLCGCGGEVDMAVLVAYKGERGM